MKEKRRRQNLHIGTILIVGLVLLFGCAEKFKTYENYADRVRIKYPINWEVHEDAFGSVVTFLSPQEDASDQFQENLNIIIQDLEGESITLKEYSEAVIKQVKRIVPSEQIEESDSEKLSREDAHQVIFTGQQGPFRLRLMQIWTLKNNRAYMVTFTAEEKEYWRLEKTINKMLKSLQIM